MTAPSVILLELCLVYVAPIYLLPPGINSNSNPFKDRAFFVLVSSNLNATTNPEPSTDFLSNGNPDEPYADVPNNPVP